MNSKTLLTTNATLAMVSGIAFILILTGIESISVFEPHLASHKI